MFQGPGRMEGTFYLLERHHWQYFTEFPPQARHLREHFIVFVHRKVTLQSRIYHILSQKDTVKVTLSHFLPRQSILKGILLNFTARKGNLESFSSAMTNKGTFCPLYCILYTGRAELSHFTLEGIFLHVCFCIEIAPWRTLCSFCLVVGHPQGFYIAFCTRKFTPRALYYIYSTGRELYSTFCPLDGHQRVLHQVFFTKGCQRGHPNMFHLWGHPNEHLHCGFFFHHWCNML